MIFKQGNLPSDTVILNPNKKYGSFIYAHPTIKDRIPLEVLQKETGEWQYERSRTMGMKHGDLYGVYFEPGNDPRDVKMHEVLAPDQPQHTIVRLRRITGYLSELDNWNPSKYEEHNHRQAHTGQIKQEQHFTHVGDTTRLVIYFDKHELKNHLNLLQQKGNYPNDHRITLDNDRIANYLQVNPQIRQITVSLENNHEGREQTKKLAADLKRLGYDDIKIQPPNRGTWHQEAINAANEHFKQFQSRRSLDLEINAMVASDFQR